MIIFVFYIFVYVLIYVYRQRRPSRLRNRWLDLVQQDSNCSPDALLRKAVDHFCGARMILRPPLLCRTDDDDYDDNVLTHLLAVSIVMRLLSCPLICV